MTGEWLQPQVAYRLADLGSWLSIPVEPLWLAAQHGDIRSLGEGPLHTMLLGVDVIDFVREHELPVEITPEGRRALAAAEAAAAADQRAESLDLSVPDTRRKATDVDKSPPPPLN